MTENFTQLQIVQAYVHQLLKQGIERPTEVQSEAIPVMMSGKDVIIQSHTGSGKTLAYVLPALQRIDPMSKHIQVMIVVPTRELGMQIMTEIKKLVDDEGIRAQALIGGAAVSRQIEKLKSHPHLVVGTPGRLIELIKTRKVSLNEVKMLIVDEVDQVFDLSSVSEVEHIFRFMQKSSQWVFVSATIPPSLSRVIDRWMKQPISINTTLHSASKVVQTVEHFYVLCDERDKVDTLRKLVRMLNPQLAIVFINETEDIVEVLAKTQHVGLSMQALYAQASKQDRAKTMNDFRMQKFQLLLATDMASRGLDIEGVTHIIHLDPATQPDNYLHRVGRTGRMGRKGISISIITAKERFILEKFEKSLGIQISPKSMYKGEFIQPTMSHPAAVERSRPIERNKPKLSKNQQPVQSLQGLIVDSKDKRKEQSHTSPQVKRLPTKPTKSKTQIALEQKNKGAPKWLKDKQKQTEHKPTES